MEASQIGSLEGREISVDLSQWHVSSVVQCDVGNGGMSGRVTKGYPGQLVTHTRH
jgi:hypothetical protein